MNHSEAAYKSLAVRREARLKRIEYVKQRMELGIKFSTIAKELGVNPKTVSIYAREITQNG